MTMKTTGNSGRYLSEEYHRVRDEARRSLGIFEWGDIDIERYDLDNIQFDRKMRKTQTDPRIETEGSVKSGHPLNYDDPVRD